MISKVCQIQKREVVKKFLEEYFWYLKFKENLIKFLTKLKFCFEPVLSDEIVFKKNILSKCDLYIFSGLSKTNPSEPYYPMLYIDLYENNRFIDGSGIYLPKNLNEQEKFLNEIVDNIKNYEEIVYRKLVDNTLKEKS